jgi:hypothetical protein
MDLNAEAMSRTLGTLERMAESLRPAMRDAVAPVGKTCSSMSFGKGVIITEDDAEKIRSPSPDEITEERVWLIVVTELDRESCTGKIRFYDEESNKRTRARITDPALYLVDNPYIRSFASRAPIEVKGKAEIRDGEIQTLFISNAKNPGEELI